MRPFKKNKNKNSIEKKERKRGRVFTIILYKTYHRKSKEINFLMPLHRKHCKEGTTVVT
jgi:hypothetical protein